MAQNDTVENLKHHNLELTTDDLAKLLKNYFDHTLLWYEIGLHLGIKDAKLKVIQKNNQHECYSCFREMLSEWLNNTSSPTEAQLKKATMKAQETTSKPKSQTEPEEPNTIFFLLTTVFTATAVALLLYNVYFPTPIDTAAEILIRKYTSLNVLTFNIIGSKSDQFLDIVMKDISESEQDFRYTEASSGCSKPGNKFEDQDGFGKTSSTFGHSEFLSNYTGESGGRVIITGLAGSGKTSFMRYLAQKWAEGRALQSCKILFLIDLSEYDTGTHLNSIYRLLTKSGYKDLKNIQLIAESIYGNDGDETCFLFDDYHDLGDNKYVDEIVGQKLQAAFCILATRSYMQLLEKFQKPTRFEIIGYDKSHLSHHLRYITDNASLIHAIEKLWETDESIREMCTLPLNMAMILHIYRSGGNYPKIKTKTQLYLAFINETVIHHDYRRNHSHNWERESLWQCIHNGSSHGNSVCTTLKTLHQVAYDMHFNHKKLFQKEPNTFDNIKKLSFVREILVPVRGSTQSNVKYAFQHKTFLEFFVALCLLTLPVHEQLAYITIKRHKYPAGWSKIVEFLIGLTSEFYQNNISAISPFLKQLTWESHFSLLTYNPLERRIINGCGAVIDYGLLQRLKEITGWAYQVAIDKVLVTKSTLCVQMVVFDLTDFKSYASGELQYFLRNWKSYNFQDKRKCVAFLNNSDPVRRVIVLYKPFVSECHTYTESLVRYPDDYSSMTTNSTDRCVTHLHDQFTPTDVHEYVRHHHTQNQVLPNDAKTELFFTINTCLDDYHIMWIWMLTLPHQTVIHLKLEGSCTDKFISLCQHSRLQHLQVEVIENAQVKPIIECLHQTRNLLELDITFSVSVDVARRKHLIENLPQTLSILTISRLFDHSDDEVLALSDRLLSLHNISSIFLYNQISRVGVELLVNALLSSHLHTLELFIAQPDDIKPLVHLSSLKHLKIVFSDTEIDESTSSTMVTNLNKFTKLKTFEMEVHWLNKKGRLNKKGQFNQHQQLSSIFTTTQVEHIHIQIHGHHQRIYRNRRRRAEGVPAHRNCQQGRHPPPPLG